MVGAEGFKIKSIGLDKLEGTKTLENLMRAFEAEALSITRYKLYADKAEDEMIKELLERVANNELEHAEVIAEMLGAIGDDKSNLKKSFAFESFVSTIDYPSIAAVAKEEGFLEVSEKFTLLAAIEESHKQEFEQMYNNLEKNVLYKRVKKTKWRCVECGYIEEAFEAPAECPFCGHDQDDFIVLVDNFSK